MLPQKIEIKYMIEALSYLPCRGNSCTIGVFAINQGLTILIALFFIAIVTVLLQITILPLHRYLCSSFKVYKVISNVIIAIIGIYIVIKLIT